MTLVVGPNVSEDNRHAATREEHKMVTLPAIWACCDVSNLDIVVWIILACLQVMAVWSEGYAPLRKL